MMKSQIDTLYQIRDQIREQKKTYNERTCEYAELERKESALNCAIFELENK